MVARFQSKPEQRLESLYGEQEGMGCKVWEVEAEKWSAGQGGSPVSLFASFHRGEPILKRWVGAERKALELSGCAGRSCWSAQGEGRQVRERKCRWGRQALKVFLGRWVLRRGKPKKGRGNVMVWGWTEKTYKNGPRKTFSKRTRTPPWVQWKTFGGLHKQLLHSF